jgi:hypothetical protein
MGVHYLLLIELIYLHSILHILERGIDYRQHEKGVLIVADFSQVIVYWLIHGHLYHGKKQDLEQ